MTQCLVFARWSELLSLSGSQRPRAGEQKHSYRHGGDDDDGGGDGDDGDGGDDVGVP